MRIVEEIDVNYRVPIKVIDDFYDNPDDVRNMAVSAKWWPFPVRYQEGRPNWYITMERDIDRSPNGKCSFKHGTVHKTDWHKDLFNNFLGEYDEKVDDDWDTTAGSCWNGAFHYRNHEAQPMMIHPDSYPSSSDFPDFYGESHYIKRGYTCLTYLNPITIKHSGTTIWLDRETDKTYSLVSEYHWEYENPKRWKKIATIENIYNRAIFFRSDIFHRGEAGFGKNQYDSRLLHQHFFNSKPKGKQSGK